MDVKGQHLIIDAFGCSSEILNNADQLKELLSKKVTEIGMEILSTYFHSFSPQGVTGVISISTSHFSIHTWPEHGYAALDLYTCGKEDLWPALKEILLIMKAERACVYELTRGSEHLVSSIGKEVELFPDKVAANPDKTKTVPSLQLQADRGNEWDMRQLKQIVKEEKNLVFHGVSPFQDILLVETKDLRLYLDQELQFSSLDERYYHEALIFPAMEHAKSRKRVLILGGGDGLGLREVLKYPDVEHVDLVDIDPLINKIASHEPALVTLNNGSLLDNRVMVHIEDAKKYIMEEHPPYNVIIIDFPDPVDAIISSLYTVELFSQVAKLLATDGALVCQSNSPEDAPRAFWSIAETMEKAGLNTVAYNNIVPSFGLWGYHLAAHKKILKKPLQISVPHQTLPGNLEALYKIPSSIMAAKKGLLVNRLNKLKLHELYQEEILNWFN